jgi:tellurite resistance protein TehA-like permease
MWSTVFTSESERLALGMFLVALAVIALWLSVRAKISVTTVIFGLCCLIWLAIMIVQLLQLNVAVV